MNIYAKNIKKKLDESIEKLSKVIFLFSKNPEKDFTRNRKLPIKKLIEFLIFMGGNTQTKELLEHFKFDIKRPTASAFIQQRNKLKPEALSFVLNEFLNSFEKFKTFKGYRCIAVDGSKVSIPLNPEDKETYTNRNKNSKGFNLLHINALYDVLNNLYLDATVQAYRKTNEFKALVDMMKRSNINEKVILLADRGYESYNNIAHLENKNWNYLIRVKAPNSGTGILSKAGLPVDKEFDEEVTILLTRKQNKKNFLLNDLKALYHERWGVEISFRELKYTLGMTHFHSQKVEHIKQEIYAKLILYNFCKTITLNVVITQDNNKKYIYKVNFNNASHICIRFYRYFGDMHPPDVEALIAKYISPIREKRKFARKMKSQSFVSFFYRVS